MNTKKLIEEWILKELSKKKSFLGGNAVCPYASDAMIKKNITIEICDSVQVFDFLEKALKSFSENRNQIRVVALPLTTNKTTDELQEYVQVCRERYFNDDIWVLFDHPEIVEEVEGYRFNQGSHILFIIQKLSELVESSRQLKLTGYYQKWPSDYFKDVVELREEYYARFLKNSKSENDES